MKINLLSKSFLFMALCLFSSCSRNYMDTFIDEEGLTDPNFSDRYGSQVRVYKGDALRQNGTSTRLTYQSYAYLQARIADTYTRKRERRFMLRKFKKAKFGLFQLVLVRNTPTALDPSFFDFKVSYDPSNFSQSGKKNTIDKVNFSSSSLRETADRKAWFNNVILGVNDFSKKPVIFLMIVDKYAEPNDTLIYKIQK